MAAPVFISHSSRDKSIAQTLCRALEQRGLPCWISSRDITPGQNFQEAIVKALTSARVMVLVFSSHANNSDEIKKELALASQNRLAVVPARVEDVLPTDAFKYELATRQWIDVFADWERAVSDLANHVRGIIDDLPPVATPEPAPVVARRKLPAILLAAAIVAVVAGGAAAWFLGPFGQPKPPVIAGIWKSGELTNPYAADEKTTLSFEFDQTGDTLLGSVTETWVGRSVTKTGISDGHVAGAAISFVTGDDSPDSTKQTYHGTVSGDEISFIRQNNAATGGIPEKFTAKRQ
jgi:hypothetical protein